MFRYNTLKLVFLSHIFGVFNSERYSELFIKKGGNLREDFLLTNRSDAVECSYVRCLYLIS